MPKEPLAYPRISSLRSDPHEAVNCDSCDHLNSEYEVQEPLRAEARLRHSDATPVAALDALPTEGTAPFVAELFRELLRLKALSSLYEGPEG